jgi:hypothetical protein
MECYTCKSIIHFHLIPKPRDLPDELKASKIFAMLHVEKEGAIPPDEIRALCEHLKAHFG